MNISSVANLDGKTVVSQLQNFIILQMKVYIPDLELVKTVYTQNPDLPHLGQCFWFKTKKFGFMKSRLYKDNLAYTARKHSPDICSGTSFFMPSNEKLRYAQKGLVICTTCPLLIFLS